MPKIARKLHQTFIDATPSATATYEVLGSDIEDLSVELAKNVETTQNILGQSSVKVTNGAKNASVAPYMADSDSDLFTFLQNAIDNDLELDSLKTNVVEVKLWETETAGSWPAIKEDVFIEPVSYGGNTTGYQIPFNIHYTGTKVAGSFNPETKTFTAD